MSKIPQKWKYELLYVCIRGEVTVWVLRSASSVFGLLWTDLLKSCIIHSSQPYHWSSFFHLFLFLSVCCCGCIRLLVSRDYRAAWPNTCCWFLSLITPTMIHARPPRQPRHEVLSECKAPTKGGGNKMGDVFMSSGKLSDRCDASTQSGWCKEPCVRTRFYYCNATNARVSSTCRMPH